MEIVENLKGLGLTDGEAKVYLALTELGSSTVGPIVSKSRVAYSNVYEILSRLIEKGLVSFIVKEKTKYFQAGSPENLNNYLDKQQEEIEQNKVKLKSIISGLEKLKEIPPEQEAEVFVGLKGLRTAYEKLLSGLTLRDEHIFLYSHNEEWGEMADNLYFSMGDLIKKTNTRGVSNLEGKKSEFNKRAKGYNVKIRYASFPLPGNWEGNRDMVLVISWGKIPTAILIKSKAVFNDFKEYFESAWKAAKF
jgi:sugar-specific transcriptional regulator TrmB